MTKKLFRLAMLFVLGCCAGAASAQYVTLTGTLSASNGLPASNYNITFTPSQFGYISGTGVFINTTTSCATSNDGSVVGLPNPLVAPVTSVGFTGTLPANNYYVKLAFYDASSNLTVVSPERVQQLNSTGQLIVASPVSGLPAGAVGMKVYISVSPNTETLQGQTTGTAAFIQSVPLVTGVTPPAVNSTICKQVANDAIWPVGTGYTVGLTDPGGNTLPGYPMMWQLMGPNTTIDLSNGLPYYHGTVYFPTPILSIPPSHALQSISGNLSLSDYNLLGVGAIGVGTNSPAWPIDVENGAINARGGYIYNAGAGVSTGNCLVAGSDAYHTFTPGNCTTTTTTYYQTIQSNTTAEPQEPALNFSTAFTLSDASGVRTNVGLANTAVSAGSYTCGAFTVSSTGQLTAATSGTCINFTARCITDASPAVCGAANAGIFVVPASGFGITVDTTALDNTGHTIAFTYITSAGITVGSTTCSVAPTNINSLFLPYVDSEIPGSSFTANLPVVPSTNSLCVAWAIL